MPLNIQIDDNDVAHVAQDLNLKFDDVERRQVLKCTESKDVQAGPGCGKTTLLVAKLAILASKWKWQDRGICVLSHTNVARHEVQRRLAIQSKGQSLLGFPHFISTIQTFVDTFLALPYIRSEDRTVVAIDNDLFSARICEKAESGRFSRLYSYLLKRRFQGNVENLQRFLSGLKYSGSLTRIDCATMPLGLTNENSPTYRDLLRLKGEMSSSGIYRFDDMFALADAYILDYPAVLEAIQERFPWVFIDELQDTEQNQIDLLARLFGQNSLVQRFGDANQAIFGSALSAEQAVLFEEDSLDVHGSLRFGPTIAEFASRLTVRPATITSESDQRNGNHTVFLFEPCRIQQVLPAFGNLLLNEYPAIPDNFVAKAVGAIHRSKETHKPENVPNCVTDYWPAYVPDATLVSARPQTMLLAVRKAKHIVYTANEFKEAHSLLIDSMLDLLRISGATAEENTPFTRTSLKKHLSQSDQSLVNSYKTWLLNAIQNNPAENQIIWDTFIAELTNVLQQLFRVTYNDDSATFLAWSPDIEANNGTTPARIVKNQYIHERDGRSIPITLGSIHSVKGESHTATLVLETRHYEHDAQKVIPYLIGDTRVTANIKPRLREHLKRIFVAISRPRELVCFALHQDHISTAQRQKLIDTGWRVEQV